MVGGSEIAIDELTRHLPDTLFDIVTPRFESSQPKFERRDNRAIHRLGTGSVVDKFLFPVTGFMYGLRLLARHRYQAIHAYQASYGALAAVMVKSHHPRTPLIVTLQEGKDLGRQFFGIRLMRRYVLRHADRITAISSYLKGYARQINPRARIDLIPNGIDPDHFKRTPSNIRPRLASAAGPIVMTVSRLVPKNGVGDLVRAFSILKQSHQFALTNLVIIGSGPLELDLKSLVRALKIEQSVRFLGTIPYPDLPGYLSAASVFVRPSRSEGLGSAFLEAMACGVPVIGSRVGGITDIIIDRKTGLLCEAGNPEDVAHKISTILSDPILAEELARQGRALVEREYTWQTAADKFRKLYEEL